MAAGYNLTYVDEGKRTGRYRSKGAHISYRDSTSECVCLVHISIGVQRELTSRLPLAYPTWWVES